jgi:LmbE family N-acetylglucosaminyl deacetylase
MNRYGESLPDVDVVEPDAVFPGTMLIAVPHMDDEALACAGTIARLSRKSAIHLVYATDGMKSPEPVLPWRDSISHDLGAIRRRESITAMTSLGVPEENLHFLKLPEGELERHRPQLDRMLRELVQRTRPDHILAPFRYDRHRDHIAVNHAVTAIVNDEGQQPQLWEYFVYHRWRLLPRRDIRAYINPMNLVHVDVSAVSAEKRAALDCFKSQTTRFYSWQSRPNLTPALLDGVSQEPELFVKFNPALAGTAVFDRSLLWIQAAHRLESPLKRAKDRFVAVWRRAFGRVSTAA